MPPPKNLINQRFGRLTVIALAPKAPGNPNRRWAVSCDCGLITVVFGMDLTSGKTMSCGCLRREYQRERPRIKHGQSKRTGHRASPVYTSWSGIKDRCLNPNSPAFPRYGGRGIKVCLRWRSFPQFAEDVGERPSSAHSIDRINNDGHYSCGKCTDCRERGWVSNWRWATKSEQARNRHTTRRLTLDGNTKSVVEWSLETCLRSDTIRMRLKRGWSVERALTEPLCENRSHPKPGS